MNSLYTNIEDHLSYIKHVLDQSENTVKNRAHILKSFAGMVSIRTVEEINNKVIDEWIIIQRQMAEVSGRKISGRTINTRLSHLRSFLVWCETQGIEFGVKMRTMPKLSEETPRRSFYNRHTINEAITAAKPDEALLIKILFDSCMRRTEVTNLRVSDIDGRTLSYIGKGRVQSIAYIDENTRIMLDEWILDNGITNYIFPSPYDKNKPISPDTACRKVRRAFERIGVSGAYTHAMRHSGATDLELNGAPIQLISKILHHSKLTTTQIYTHGFENNLMEMRDFYKTASC